MTLVPSYLRCLVYAIVSMAAFLAVAIGQLVSANEDSDTIVFIGTGLAVGSLFFILVGPFFVQQMFQVTLDEKRLVHELFGGKFAEIPFSDVKSVSFHVIGYHVSRGLFSRGVLIPTLFLKRRDRQALNAHLQKVLPQENPLRRLVR